MNHPFTNRRWSRSSLELTLNGISEAYAAVFPQMQRQLLVEHIAIEEALIIVQDAFSKARLTHRLDHLAYQ